VSAHEIDRLRSDLADLRRENARLRRLVIESPASDALRFVAPFITAAIDAGLWGGTEHGGAAAVDHQMRSALAFIDRLAPPATPTEENEE
jgi:hypothetical protein